MADKPYHLESNLDGTWSVIDAQTALPARARSRVLDRLPLGEAQDALNLMIWIGRLRPQAAPPAGAEAESLRA